MLMNKRAEEVMPKIAEERRSSSSVIARLMGLDELPYSHGASESKYVTGHPLLKKSLTQLHAKQENFENDSFTLSQRQHDNVKIDHGFYDSKSENNNYLKIQQEPRSLCTKYFHGLKCMKSLSCTRKFNNIESSAGEKIKMFYQTMEKSKEYARQKKNSTHCCTDFDSHSAHVRLDSLLPAYDYLDSLLLKLLRSQPAENTESSTYPRLRNIVVLKPSVQSVHKKRTDVFTRPLENSKPIYRRHMKFYRETYFEREQHHFYGTYTKDYKVKACNHMASDISQQKMPSFRNNSAEMLAAKIDGLKPSIFLRKTSKRKESKAILSVKQKTTMPYMSRLPYEASTTDGWKVDGDMWLQNDEKPTSFSDFCRLSRPKNRWQVSNINSIDDTYMRKYVIKPEQNYLRNSISDAGRSLPQSLNSNDKKSDFSELYGKEKRRRVREFEVCEDEVRNMNNLGNLIEPKPIHLQRKRDDLLQLVCTSDLCYSDPDNFFLANLKEFQQSGRFNELSVIVHEAEIQETLSANFPLVESHLDATRQSQSLISAKVAERLSPVSVLEPPSEDGKLPSDFLDRLGEGIIDIQRQLNILELETIDSDDQQFKSLMFNDIACMEILKSLKKEHERDFVYLLDILDASGIYAASKDMCYDACYSLEAPVFPDVFDKLERKYNIDNLWHKSERKLLFDHINSILAELLAPCINLHPWVKLKRSVSCRYCRLITESWKLLVLQMNALSKGKPEDKVLDNEWLCIDDYVDMAGREIERMLKDDLINELVSELM